MRTIIPYFPNPFNAEDVHTILSSKEDINIENLGFDDKRYQFVDSGRSGIRLLLRSFNLPCKSKVGLPYLLCDSVRRAIIQEGFQPHYFDVNDDLQIKIDLDIIILSGIKALILPHLYGIVHPQIEDIIKICNDNSIYLIQDTAQSFGLKYHNKYVIEMGDGGIYSFGPGKASAAIGGAVVYGLKNEIKYNKMPIIFKWIKGIYLKKMLLIRTFNYDSARNRFNDIIFKIVNRIMEYGIYNICGIQYNAIMQYKRKYNEIKNRREENWNLMNNFFNTVECGINILNYSARGMKYKYVISSENKDLIDIVKKNLYRNGIYIRTISRGKKEDKKKLCYIEISTEASIPKENIHFACRIINNIINNNR